MAGVTEAKLAMDGIKLALDVVKALQSGKAGAEFKAQLVEARSSILDAQEHASAAYARETELTQRIRDLEEKVTHFETWSAEKQRYELQEVSGGNFAYRVKETERGVGPVHYICPACYERGQKMILQSLHTYDGGPVHGCLFQLGGDVIDRAHDRCVIECVFDARPANRGPIIPGSR